MSNNPYEKSFVDQLKENKSLLIRVIAGLLIGLAVILGLWYFFGRSQTPTGSWVPSSSVKVGNADANVKVVYFYDLQCPACASNDPELEATQNALQDRVQFIYRNMPLKSIHPYAELAGRGAEALALQDQSKYFEYKKEIFAKQNQLDPSVIEEIGQRLAPDAARWNRDRNSLNIDNQVKADYNFITSQTLPPSSLSQGKTKADSTPTTVILKDDKPVDWWSGGLPSAQQIELIQKQL